MTANAGYHAYATGDVLTAAQVQYNLQNQSVMYFATSAARTTALSGVTVEGMVTYIPANGIEYYNGTAWIGVTSNASNVPNLSNPVLNSAFQVWQRGTSIAIAASSGATSATYTADRWQTTTGANQAVTVSRQATSDTTNLPNIQYCARYQRNSGQTGTGGLNFAQSFESVNAIPFAGKTVTLSFYARAGANYSSASNALSAVIYTGTGTDQNRLAGSYTGDASPISQTATLTTTWQRFSYSATLGSTVTELAVLFGYTPVGTAGTNDYYEITGVQLELGSVATPFDTYATTYQGELAACQRYYQRYSIPTATGAGLSTGVCTSTTIGDTSFVPPVSFRVAPTTLDTLTPEFYTPNNNGQNTSGTFTLASFTTSTNVVVRYTHGSAVFTAGYAAFLSTSASSGYYGIGAEI
jgi:hypothetical protein